MGASSGEVGSADKILRHLEKFSRQPKLAPASPAAGKSPSTGCHTGGKEGGDRVGDFGWRFAPAQAPYYYPCVHSAPHPGKNAKTD
jgi:hypothetical protein